MVVVLLAAVSTHVVRLDRWNPQHLNLAAAVWLLAGQAVFMLGIGFTEELLMRGYVFQNLGERLPTWSALLLSVLFALLHGLSTHWIALVEIALGGLMLGLFRIATGTLWMAIGFHAAWDVVEDGVVTTKLLPAHGPELEATLTGWVVPVVMSGALLAVLTLRGRRVGWPGRLEDLGALPESSPQANTSP
jgi:membrane protease YdiL (CAAX protease family)